MLEDGKEIGLEEASSGLQSVVPLYVYVYYLTHWIYDHQEDISFEKKDRIEGALSREYIKMFSKQMNVVMDEEFLNQAVKEAKLSPGFKKILGTAKTLKKRVMILWIICWKPFWNLKRIFLILITPTL